MPAGFKYSVPTSAPGNYVLEIHDESGRVWNKFSFSVVGRGEVSRSLEKNAELQVKLNRAIQRRRRNRNRHHRALHRQRPDHDRERQGLRAPMVHQQHDEQRATHPRAGRFRRHRLRQRLFRARARFEGNFHEPAQLRRRAVHREQGEAPTACRSARQRYRQARRAVADRLQNRSAGEDRRLRAWTRASSR